jgi:hypothetical protein
MSSKLGMTRRAASIPVLVFGLVGSLHDASAQRPPTARDGYQATRIAMGTLVGVTSPDGAWHAYTNAKTGNVELYDLAHRRAATTLHYNGGATGCTAYTWSLDSQQLAYVADTGKRSVGDDFRLEVYDLRTGKTRTVGSERPCNFAFDASGRVIWRPWNRPALRREDEARPVVEIAGGGQWMLEPPEFAVRRAGKADVAYYLEFPGPRTTNR